MTRKAITVHLLTTDNGNHHWELRTATDGRLIADSISDGEYSAFGSEKTAMDDALKIAAVYLEHGKDTCAV